MQLSHSLTRLSRSIGQTADLCEQLKSNLDAMRVLAASHAAQFITVATELTADPEADAAAEKAAKAKRAGVASTTEEEQEA